MAAPIGVSMPPQADSICCKKTSPICVLNPAPSNASAAFCDCTQAVNALSAVSTLCRNCSSTSSA